MLKANLRKVYLDRQKSLDLDERSKKSLRICMQFFANFDLDDVRFLHLFLLISEKNEVDTSFFINDLWSDYINTKTVVPRVDFERDILEHLRFNSETTLKVNHWGIPEPVGEDFIDERKIDLVLVPLLCFDERGYRVGHGKGYYDKFLSECREDTLKIGLSFFEPIKEIKDIHRYDIRLNFCITPEKVWKLK